MEITDLCIDLPSNSNYGPDDNRRNLLACFSLVFDEEFAVHSIKLIRGDKGIFLAMPAERKTDHCPSCRGKNHLMANYCNNCGVALEKDRHLKIRPNNKGQVRLYNDMAFPITQDLRKYLLDECMEAWEEEKANPGTNPSSHKDPSRRVG